MQLTQINDPLITLGRKILTILSKHGEAYIVGGAVRDLVMGNALHDVDISTNVPMEVIETLFETHDIGKNKDFGIVVVNFEGVNVEIAQFRTDGAYLDGRHPEGVKLGVSFEEDTKRRDFSMNAMGLDLNGNVLDFHGGLEDIRCGRLRTVGRAYDRFEEDLLRILRAIRFAARFNYQLDEEILQAIHAQGSRLLSVSMERIRDELLKTIEYGSDKFGKALRLIQKANLSRIIFGELNISTAIISLLSSKTYDSVVVFSVLFKSLSRSGCEYLCDRLKLTTDDKKQILYINENMGVNYYHLKDGNMQVALRRVQNPAFKKLRVAMAISDSKHLGCAHVIDKEVEEILEYVPVQEKQKDVNQILLSKGFKGQSFGHMLQNVNNWMFADFGKSKKVKENSEIEDYIEGILEEDRLDEERRKGNGRE